MARDLDGASKTVHSEIQKLRASFFNGCGIAAVAAGFLVPAAKAWATPGWLALLPAAGYGLFGLTIGYLFHSIASCYILKIKE